VSSEEGTSLKLEKFSFPITVNVVYPVSSAHYGFTVVTTQRYEASRIVLRNGILEDFNSVTNSATASDVSPASSSQQYALVDLKGPSYNCRIASSNNVLTSVSNGCGD
jgi:hypothetical protein